MFFGLGEEGNVTLLGLFIDDTGTHAGSPVVGWGGFVGTVPQWAKLDAAWKAKLACPFDDPFHARPPLKKFHLAQCQAKEGEFAYYNEAESAALQYAFRQIIADAGVVGVAFTIDQRAYDRLVTGEARAFFGSAESMCFLECFRGAKEQAQRFFPDEDRISVWFDQVSQKDRMDELIGKLDSVRDLPTFGQKPLYDSVFVGKVIDHTPLQAADILVTENYWRSIAFLSDPEAAPRAHFRSFLDSIRTVGYLLDETMIKRALRQYDFEPQP